MRLHCRSPSHDSGCWDFLEGRRCCGREMGAKQQHARRKGDGGQGFVSNRFACHRNTLRAGARPQLRAESPLCAAGPSGRPRLRTRFPGSWQKSGDIRRSNPFWAARRAASEQGRPSRPIGGGRETGAGERASMATNNFAFLPRVRLSGSASEPTPRADCLASIRRFGVLSETMSMVVCRRIDVAPPRPKSKLIRAPYPIPGCAIITSCESERESSGGRVR